MARTEIWFDISVPPAYPADLAMMRTLITHRQRGDETARERTGHPPSYAEAKKMKSLSLHTHGYFMASLRDCFSILLYEVCVYVRVCMCVCVCACLYVV